MTARALKAIDPVGLCDPKVTSCEATASTAEGGVQYGGGQDATVTRQTEGGRTASKPGRSIPSAPPISPSLPRAPQGLMGAARDAVAGQIERSDNPVEVGAGAIAWVFLAGASTYEELPRLVLNFPSNAEIGGQHFARAAYTEGGPETTLEVLEGVHSLASSAEGALLVAAPVAGALETQTRQPVVIGENMARVNGYAKNVGGETITDWLGGRDWSPQLNKEFVETMKGQGREFIDIGPDFGRRLQNRTSPNQGAGPSATYGQERRDLLGYDNYSRVFERAGKYQGGVRGFDFQAPP